MMSMTAGPLAKSATAAVAAALALLAPWAAAAQPAAAPTGYVQTQRDITFKLGLAIAEAAIAECARTGAGVSVAVIDRAGRVRVFIAADDPAPHNFELARRKAYTARTFRRPSLEWAQRTADGSELAPQRQLADVIALGGGVPITVGTDTIGAVGVSGSSQSGDDACARAGVASVADQLKAD